MSRDDRPQVAAVLDPAEERDDPEQRDQAEQDPDGNQERDDVAASIARAMVLAG